ncbi:MAG TPA: T9SS type A sorting domain-containing protein, partial [Saprospiraceae bacterium]|nr:T9SS type A sorting domain-containing protein [Saprospiraceae bacterium]
KFFFKSSICSMIFSEIFIYPNPTYGTFIIESKGDLEIYNLIGEKIFEQKLIADKTEIALKNQVTGVYCIKIIAGNKIYSQKIMIQ